jgi:hypothetical protein
MTGRLNPTSGRLHPCSFAHVVGATSQPSASAGARATGRVTDVSGTITADQTPDAMDNLAWDDWDAAVCSLENGPDCAACEG